MRRSPLYRGLLLSVMACGVAGLSPGSAHAVIGALDQVPAATLLLPHFEVDLDDPNGPQTRFTVINTDAAPALAKVTLWSDLGVPTFNFDVYLEGRDTVEIDLRLVFTGVLPQTGPGLVTLGGQSDPSANFPGCGSAGSSTLGASLPTPDLLSEAQIAHLRSAHTGLGSSSFGGQCAGIAHGDRVARGYATVDVVNACSVVMPTTPGYLIADNAGIASTRNVLAGSFALIERRAGGSAASSALVHIEADTVAAETTTPGNYTFYSTFVGASAADNREPAGAVWQARKLGGDFAFEGSELIVWRDPGRTSPTPFVCGSVPFGFPLGQVGVQSWNESEDVFNLNTPPVFPNPPPPPALPFAWASQRVDFSEITPFESGWSVLNLNFFGAPAGDSIGGVRQSVVLVRHRTSNGFGPFQPATYSAGPLQLDSPEQCARGESCSSFTPATWGF